MRRIGAESFRTPRRRNGSTQQIRHDATHRRREDAAGELPEGPSDPDVRLRSLVLRYLEVDARVSPPFEATLTGETYRQIGGSSTAPP